MSENTAPPACTESEWDMARAAGLVVATTADERAIHAFAEAVRGEQSQAAASCKRALELDRLHLCIKISILNSRLQGIDDAQTLALDAASAIGRLVASLAAQSRLRTESSMAEQSAIESALEWRAMCSAPLDGTRVKLLVRHANWWTAQKQGQGEAWEAVALGAWLDFNGGGWSWDGMAGTPVGWQPIVDGEAP